MCPAGSSTSSSSPGRRGLLLGGLGGLLAGCGFRPLYGPAGGAPDGAVAAELAAIRVGLVPERQGQLIRRTLQERLERGGPRPARYTLTVALQFGAEAQGFRRDGAPTRQRWTLAVPWTLSTMSVPPVVVSTGAVRAFDANNIPDQEFFAADAASEAAQRRLIEQVSADLVERLAVVLRDRAPA